MSIPDLRILYDCNLVSIRQEGIELADEEGVAVEKVSYPLDDAGCVNPALWSAKRELKCNGTHNCPLKSFMISRNKLYTSGLCWN